MSNITDEEYNRQRMLDIKAIIILCIIIALMLLLTGCSKTPRFYSYKEVSMYCYNMNFTASCEVEKCIMLNSAEFSDDIKFSAEKNYYQCKLIECRT